MLGFCWGLYYCNYNAGRQRERRRRPREQIDGVLVRHGIQRIIKRITHTAQYIRHRIVRVN